MFTRTHDSLHGTYGYHPATDDLAELLAAVPTHRLLISDGVTDVVRDAVDAMRVATLEGEDFAAGTYWFDEGDGAGALVFHHPAGGTPASGQQERVDALDDEHPLTLMCDWAEQLWDEGVEVPRPRFAVHEDVLISTGLDYPVRRRRWGRGGWTYELRIDGQNVMRPERALAPMERRDDPVGWVSGEPDSAHRLSATLTRAKLTGAYSDTLFSFRATKTIFRAYQFKPLVRMLESGKSRILIADEVGLGKTIEAGLIWTELEARREADRVLVVCPSSLVAKWRQEMEERFALPLVELSGGAFDDFVDRARRGRLPRRFAHVISLEKLLRWEDLGDLVAQLGPLDLAVIDEAHRLRNAGTKSAVAGQLVASWATAVVLLTATPINLRNDDLVNLLELLTPGEFGRRDMLEQQLAPNAVLNRLGALVEDTGSSAQARSAALAQLPILRFGGPVSGRPEYRELVDLVGRSSLDAQERVKARRLIARLNVLSSVLTRTRRVEVEEKKPVRHARAEEIAWDPAEQAFYTQYVEWCRVRAELAGMPVGFSMQMPMRLASACLPVARDAVLNWRDTTVVDEDSGLVEAVPATAAVRPHLELQRAAHALGDRDEKLARLRQVLPQVLADGRRALLFTFSRPTLAYLARQLGTQYRVAVLHGGVPRDRRKEVMAAFRAGEYDLVLANRVASEGLDFEFCSAVINYDLPWNPMEVEQRIGRIDRIGQQAERLLVVNFWAPAALDETMKRRLLERVRVFEEGIGQLEPILGESYKTVRDTAYDFSLTAEERLRRVDDALAALAEDEAGREDLESAKPFLLGADGAEVRGMEDDVVRTGRYVGAAELRLLLDDWATSSGARPTRVSDGGRRLSLRGNADMASRVAGVVTSGRLRREEAEEYRRALQDEVDVHLVLDHELGRTSSAADLLTARHPLVLAATATPEARLARFGHLRARCTDGTVAPGRYFVLLAAAEWGSVRPGRELWGAALDQRGGVVDGAPVDLLLSALAEGRLEPSTSAGSEDLTVLVQKAVHLLDDRAAEEGFRREQEAEALVAARRVLVEQQHENRLANLEQKLATSRARGNAGVRLFTAQIASAERAHSSTMAALESAGAPDLRHSFLAACALEVTS